MCAVLGTRKKVIGMSESARSILKHLYKEGRMTEEQYKKIDSNLKEPQWISCSDMLPKENICDDGYVEPSDYVLVFSDHGAYGVSRYWGNRRTKKENPCSFSDWMDLEWKVQNPIAWMPLPKPYQKEGDEK